jgi:hypothetical protein
MVGARVPQDWQERIRAIAAVAGRKESEVVREALGQYLSIRRGMCKMGHIVNKRCETCFSNLRL